MPGLNPVFLQGRVPPKEFGIKSTQMRDWYDEHLYRAHEGFTHNGTRITGDHYWMLNFQPLDLFYKDPATGLLVNNWDYGFYSQTDDWILKQIEEAQQQNMCTAMMTGRGMGKTFIVLSIGSKTYYLDKGSKSIISAAIDQHADPSFVKMKQMIIALEEKHPTLALKRSKNDSDIIQAAEEKYINGVKTEVMSSQFRKLVYANSPGKSKGGRLMFQQFEEWGDWSCSATLNDCITNSEGSWKVGDVNTCRVFFTGTGGTVKSDQAREIFYNPVAYNIMPVEPYNPKTYSYPTGVISHMIPDYLPPEGTQMGIFVPSICKRGNFYEFDRYDANGELLFEAGENDLVGAFESLMKERAAKESVPSALDKLTQEFPITADEVFRQSGASEFDRKTLGLQKNRLTQRKVAFPLPVPCPEGFVARTVLDQGRLEWVYTSGRRVGVEWFSDTSEKGKIFVAEHPPKTEDGKLLPMNDLYVGGLDSIDQSDADSMTRGGSKLALAIKKRLTGLATANNFYSCFYIDRPDDTQDIEDAFDNVLKILWYYNCRVNLEYTKITIRSYFRERGEYWRFLPRMKVCSATIDEQQRSNLIGTHWDGAGMTFNHALRLLKKHLRENWAKLYDFRVVQQLIDFTKAMKTKFDAVIAMLLAELADEDLADVPPSKQEESEEKFMLHVWYTDQYGNRVYGEDPRSKQPEGITARAKLAARLATSPDFYDGQGNLIPVTPLHYASADMDYDGTTHLRRGG